MAKFSALSSELVAMLQLDQVPIAICFSDQPPPVVKAFDGLVAAGCRFWQEAAESSFTTSTDDHQLCAIGVHTHNLQVSDAQQKDLGDALKVFAELGYVRPEDISQIPVLNQPAHFVTYSPLAESPSTPDVVLLFVRANQTLILTEATQQIESAVPPAMGRPACAVVPQVMNSGRPALSLGCCGARAYLDCFTDEKAIFALPGAKLESYVERIGALVDANRILSRFHRLRARDVEQGNRPSIEESLAAFASQS